MGIRPQSSLEENKSIALTCSAKMNQNTEEPNTFYWKVNDREVFTDQNPLRISDRLVSSFQYSPQKPDSHLECLTNNQSASLQFVVENTTPQLVQLSRNPKIKHNYYTDQIIWIPFDATNKDLTSEDSKEEENKEYFRRNIYEVMPVESPLSSASQHKRSEVFKSINIEIQKPITLFLRSKSLSIHNGFLSTLLGTIFVKLNFMYFVK